MASMLVLSGACKKFITCFSILFCFLIHSQEALIQGQDNLLAFGGSFNPPTLEHMGVVARIAHRFSFAETHIIPAYPYKSSSLPGPTIIDLLKTALLHFNEVLELNGIPIYQNQFQDKTFQWQSEKSSAPQKIILDDYDIRTENRENTLKTLKYLSNLKAGDPKKVFWISGSDSFLIIEYI
jgi:nicotinic acid mononucleotide adenylyltransferase